MSKIPKILLVTLATVVVLLVLVGVGLRLYLTDERMRHLVEPILEEQLDRDVSIGGFSLGFFRSFPNLSLGIDEIAIHTPPRDGEEQPDLASVERIWIDVPVFPLLQSRVHVKALDLDNPQVLFEVYDDLSTNLGELGSQEEAPAQGTQEASALEEIALERVRIRNGQLGYLHADGTLMTVTELDADLSARLAETATLEGQLLIGDMYLEAGGIPYVGNWSLGLDVDAEAHLDSAWLRIDRARLALEDLQLALAGQVEHWDEEEMLLDLSLNAPEASVASFWSLLPPALIQDVSGLESEGVFTVEATIQGALAEGVLPAVAADLQLRDGLVQYPGVPSSIRGLYLDAQLTNDQLTVNRLNAEGDGASLMMAATLREFTRPVIDTELDIEMDLSQIGRYMPLEEGTEARGTIDIDARLSGALEQTDALTADGVVDLEGIYFASPSLEQPVEDLSGQITIDNDRVNLNDLAFVSGQSDLNIEGSLERYRAFLDPAPAPGEEPVLQGRVTSNYLNVTEQLSEDTTSTFVGPLELPPLRADVTMEVGELEFNGIPLEQASGRVTLTDGVIRMENISAQLFGGRLESSGRFDLSDPYRPAFDGGVALAEVPAAQFFDAFSDIDAIVRLGAYLEGLFNTGITFELLLDKDLNPDYPSVAADGDFAVNQGSFGTTPLQSALSRYLGLGSLEMLTVQDWGHSFSVSGERLQVQDLQLDAGEYTFSLNGQQGFDGTLDYRLTVELPESASQAIANAPVQGALSTVTNLASVALVEPESGRITLDLLAEGSFDDPALKLNTEMMQARLRSRASALAAGVREEAQARLDSLENAARSRLEAEAEAQREQLEERAREEAGDLVEGLIDSTGLSTDVDSLKEEGKDALRSRLRGLLDRKKPNN